MKRKKEFHSAEVAAPPAGDFPIEIIIYRLW